MSTKDGAFRGVGGVPSGSRSEYGDIIPIRPRPAAPPSKCLRGHRLDLGGMTATYHHLYRLHGVLCEVCRIVEQHHPPSRPLAEWAYIDTSVRYSQANAPAYGLVLVTKPPPHAGGAGNLHRRLDDTTVATVDVALRGPCHRGTVHSLHVEKRYRRLGYARTLATAAVTLQPTYIWTTEANPSTLAGRAFWTTTGLRRSQAENRCPHTA
jgi:GNAT superfamily N-acetyltransferase